MKGVLALGGEGPFVQGKLGSAVHQFSVRRWGGFDHFHLAPVSCLLILSWLVEASLADTAQVAYDPELETRVLRLGQELQREKLPFKEGGQRVYELLDLKESHWYEVKISYPALIPADFSIVVLPEHSKDSLSRGRKLLNTEKIIFNVDQESASQGTPTVVKRRVLVTVKPGGVIAKQHVQEHQCIVYNIVSEEVIFGVPVQALWVGSLGLLVILASVLGSGQLSQWLLGTKLSKQVQ